MDQRDEIVIRGSIVFPDEPPRFDEVNAYIRIEDVSEADGPAPVVLSRRIPCRYEEARSAEGVRFEMRLSLPDPRRSYSLCVHVDMDGDGRVSPGDFINVVEVPIVSGRGRQESPVPVTKVLL
jgi:hypothetical protein